MYDFPSTKEFLIQTEQHKCNLNIVQSSKLKTKEKKKHLSLRLFKNSHRCNDYR